MGIADEGKRVFEQMNEDEQQSMEGSIRVFKILFMCSFVETACLAAKASGLDMDDMMLFVSRIFGPEAATQEVDLSQIITGATKQ